MTSATIRPIAPGDVPAIAGIFQTEMRKTSAPASEGLIGYLDRLFISGPYADPELPSLVYQRDDGSVGGFIGVTALPLQVDGQPIRAAVCGALMVDGHREDPMAGARLLKTFQSGKQDVSLSETAGDTTLTMWQQMRGDVLTRHSLDWLRVIRPGAFAVETAGRRMGAARLASPIARLLDNRMTKAGSDRGLRWAALADDFKVPGGLSIEPIAAADFAEHVAAFTDSFPIQRVWAPGMMEQTLEDIGHKKDYGDARICVVRARGGTAIGSFVYYVRPNATARVLDVLASPERAGVVLDCLLRDAADQGAVAVRGRTAPHTFDALLGRRCLMFRHSASVVASRDTALVRRLQNGDAAFNGIVGERWSRLMGDSFA